LFYTNKYKNRHCLQVKLFYPASTTYYFYVELAQVTTVQNCMT